MYAAEEGGSNEPQVKLSYDARQAVEKAEKDILNNKKAFEAANKKSCEAVMKVLKGELERLTKAGKLDEAIAVKKVMEGYSNSLKVAEDVLAREKDIMARTDLLGNVNAATPKDPNEEMKKWIVGKWQVKVNNGVEFTDEFNVDGSVHRITNNTNGKWTYDGNTHELKIVWDVGYDTYTITKQDNVINGKNALSVALRMIKSK
jgi:hypothetical protein